MMVFLYSAYVPLPYENEYYSLCWRESLLVWNCRSKRESGVTCSCNLRIKIYLDGSVSALFGWIYSFLPEKSKQLGCRRGTPDSWKAVNKISDIVMEQ